MTRFLSILSASVLATAPFTVFLFVMGLVVAEVVIYPAATLATAVIAGLFGGWAGSSVIGDGKRTDLNAVVIRNLALGVLPATAAGLLAAQVARAIWLIGAVLVFTSLTATFLTFRYRTETATVASDGGLTISWLLGSVVGVGLVIFVASLFGLTGA